MATLIKPIPTGFTTSYLIKNEKPVLVDAGIPGTRDRFFRAFTETGIAPASLALIVVTHGHWDHLGALADIKETGDIPVLAGKEDSAIIASGAMPYPPALTAWGHAIIWLMKTGLLRRKAFCPVTADLILEGEEKDLRELGVDGRVIATPGHTRGSISLLLASGEAFVGDLAAGGFPMRFGNGSMPLGNPSSTV